MTIKTKYGYNLSLAPYYSQTQPFINLMKSGAVPPMTIGGVEGAHQDTNGNIVNWPSGEQLLAFLVYQPDEATYQYGRLRQGGWNLTWTGNAQLQFASWTNFVVTGTGNGVVSGGGFPNRFHATATLGNPGPTSADSAFIYHNNVTNSSGSNWNASDWAVFHDDDEVDFKAGYITTRGFRNFHRHTKSMRFMDYTPVNGLGYSSGSLSYYSFSDYPAESWRVWQGKYLGPFSMQYLLPWSVIGKIAVELGLQRIHVTVDPRFMDPGVADNATMLYTMVAELYANCGSTAEVVPEFTNERWNSLQKKLWLQRYLVENSLTPVDNNGTVVATGDINYDSCAAYGYLVARAWRIFESVFGASRVVRAIYGQQGFVPIITGSILNYVDPVSSTKIGTRAEECGSAPYFVPRTGGTVTDTYVSGDNLTMQSMCEQKAYNWTDAKWKEAFANYLALNIQWIADDRAALDGFGFTHLLHSTYEGGMDTSNVVQHNFADGLPQMYYCLTHAADETITKALVTSDYNLGYGDFVAGFDDGDLIQFANVGPSVGITNNDSTASGLAANGQDICRVKKLSGRLRVFTSQANYDANNYVKTSTGSDGTDPFYRPFINLTRFRLLQLRIKGFRNDAVGVANEVALYNALKGKATYHHQFTDAGGYADIVSSYGLDNSYHEATVNASRKVHICINYKRSTNTANLNGPFV